MNAPIWTGVSVTCTRIGPVVEAIEALVLALMNQGVTLDRVIHEVQMPARLLDKPSLRPVYGDPQFIVRNVWRLYGGWHGGEPGN